MATLHVALDESGDFNFSPKGSRHYVFAVAWTYDPAPLATALTSLRFGLLKAGDNLPSFHACEDKQAHRDAVVAQMVAQTNWDFVAIVVDKRRVNPSIREPEKFYPTFAAMPLRFVLKGCLEKDTTHLITCTDLLPMDNKKKKEGVEKMFKQAVKAVLPKGTPFAIHHHPRASNKWIQTVDYCCWSVFRKWEGKDSRTYDQLSPRLYKPELEVFRFGDGTTYY